MTDDEKKNTMSHDYKRLFVSFANLLDEFGKRTSLPWMIEVPMTFGERARTYLPWSWNCNHRTKWVTDPNAPKTIKFRWSAP